MKNHLTLGRRVMAVLAVAAFAGCTTPVEVDLPDVPVQGVMEASIRMGEPPLVFLTTTQGYFDAVDATALASLYVDDAEVVMTVDGTEVPLLKICSGELPPEALAEAAMFLGVPASTLEEVNLCVYTGLGLPATYGTVGTEYGLEAKWVEDGVPVLLRSSTQMPAVPQLDSIWFEIPETSTNDSLGLIWTAFTDPEGIWRRLPVGLQARGKRRRFLLPIGECLRRRLCGWTILSFREFPLATARCGGGSRRGRLLENRRHRGCQA